MRNKLPRRCSWPLKATAPDGSRLSCPLEALPGKSYCGAHHAASVNWDAMDKTAARAAEFVSRTPGRFAAETAVRRRHRTGRKIKSGFR